MGRTFFVLACLMVLVPASMRAQKTFSDDSPAVNPSSVLIGVFTFTRPTGWQWVDTRSHAGHIQQFVSFQTGNPANKAGCNVYINHFSPGTANAKPDIVAERWKESFSDAPASAEFSEPVLIGTNRVVYLELTGTMKPASTRKNAAAKPGTTLSGAIILHPEGNVILRLIGPTAFVRKEKPEFTNMIEMALKND